MNFGRAKPTPNAARTAICGRLMAKKNGNAMRSAYAKSRSVDPRPISGREKPAEVLEHAFSAYVGRQERTAFELMRRAGEGNCSVFLTLSGAMRPAGLD